MRVIRDGVVDVVVAHVVQTENTAVLPTPMLLLYITRRIIITITIIITSHFTAELDRTGTRVVKSVRSARAGRVGGKGREKNCIPSF